jgi:anti-sigma factor RsiW
MSDCLKINHLLVLRAEDQLSADERQTVEAHLAGCEACRSEAAEIARLVRHLADPGLFSPPADYRWEALPRTLAARVRNAPSAQRWLPVGFGRLGWAVSACSAFAVMLGIISLAHRFTPPAAAPSENAAFVRRIENVYARGATSRYLSYCQELLIQVVRADKPCEGETIDVSFEVARARDLLQRKRMLDAELDSAAVVSARGLCDELENFLVELSLADRCETPGELSRMERVIRTRQLLLRINVVQSELS